MKRLSLSLLREDAPAAAAALAATEAFHPEPGDLDADVLPDAPGERYQSVFGSARARFDKIAARLGSPASAPAPEPRVVGIDELEGLNDELGRIWREVSDLEEVRRRLEEQRRSVRNLRDSLRKFFTLDVDLGHLQRRGQFLDVHVGTVPRSSRNQLEAAAALAGYFAGSFFSTAEVDYVVVAGPAETERDIAELLRAAGFRRIEIPAEFTDHPDKVDRELAAQAAELETRHADTLSAMASIAERSAVALARAAEVLALAAPFDRMATDLRGRGGLARVDGWVPRRELPRVERAVADGLASPCLLSARDPSPDERGRVPSQMRHSMLLRPFMSLVRNYGVPRYGEFDPTLLFGITFIAMFGMMFGDVGHGIVIAIAGVALRRRYPIVLPFMLAAGAASSAFGFVYGSVFGFEHLIHPLWISPLSDPIAMLRVALLWGVVFIIGVSVLTIVNLVHGGHHLEALVGARGAAGLVLYLGGIRLAYAWLTGESMTLSTGLPLLLGLGAVIGYAWHTTSAPVAERALVVLIEAFESVVAFLSNTLSFLRVAAFSLNHVALAIAVFTLADAMGDAGRVVTIVIGNIFIIALEGAIVAIQVLRLEYYEGFSRFYRGDGREFRPLSLRTETVT